MGVGGWAFQAPCLWRWNSVTVLHWALTVLVSVTVTLWTGLPQETDLHSAPSREGCWEEVPAAAASE